MQLSRVISGLSMLLLAISAACSGAAPTPTATPAAPTPAEAQAPTSTPTSAPTATPEATQIAADPDCPLLVQQALERVDAACAATGRNQVCYGNSLIAAQPQASIEDLTFADPGDIVAFSAILSLRLSPMDTASDQWGVALMRLQASLPDTLIGQNVTFLLFGDTQLESAGDAQSFYFQSGVGDARCAEAPSSGLLIQTPQGAGRVNFRVNGVDFALEATVYLQAEPEGDLSVSVVEGEAEISAQGATQIVTAGSQTTIPLDDTRNASGPPTDPQPYTGADLLALPIYNLERPVNIVEATLRSTFAADAEGWTVGIENTENTAPTHQPADDPSDGFICASDDALWTFNAPDAWTGERRTLYGGALAFTLRQSDSGDAAPGPEVLLRSAGLTLIYTHDAPASEAWTRYQVPFDESAGWSIADAQGSPTDNLPSPVQMQSVLGNLDAVRIRVMGEVCLDAAQLLEERAPTAPDVRAARPFVEPTPVSRTASDAQAIAIGQPVEASIDEIGEVDVYTFSVQARQEVYFAALGAESSIEWRAEDASGAALFDRAGLWLGNDPGVFTLETGEYTLYVQGDADSTGSYSFFFWEVPPPQTFTLQAGHVAPDDPEAGAGVIGVPGEEDVYTFTLEREQPLLFLSQGREGEIIWTLTAEDGSAFFADEGLWQGNDFGPLTLPPGTYTITAAGDHGGTGTYSFSFFEVLTPQTFTLNVGDTITENSHGPGSGHIEASGAFDVYTLTIEDEQAVIFVALGNEDDLRWRVEDAEGERLFADEGLWQGNELGPFTLSPGTYTITVQTARGAAGTYSFAVRAASEEQR